jgi:hypothetical protein
MNKDICQNKACFNYGKYARMCGHWKMVVGKPEPIKKVSKKREQVNRKEYAPKAKAFLKEHPKCQAATAICTGASQCVHHKKGKHSHEDLLDEKFWLAVCFSCHRAIEDNPSWAKEMGFSVSRLSKTA